MSTSYQTPLIETINLAIIKNQGTNIRVGQITWELAWLQLTNPPNQKKKKEKRQGSHNSCKMIYVVHNHIGKPLNKEDDDIVVSY